MRRLIVYAVDARRRTLDDYVPFALRALREHAEMLVVVACGVSEPDRGRIALLADAVIDGGAEFSPASYGRALAELEGSGRSFDETVLTGDSWFGPLPAISSVLARMELESADYWTMVEDRSSGLPDVAFASVADRKETWQWIALRGACATYAGGGAFWKSVAKDAPEREFVHHLRSAGYRGAPAFDAASFGNDDPSVYSPDALVLQGGPLVRRLAFALYPPFLQQHAIIGRDTVRAVSQTGYPMPLLWQHLARSVAPKSLNTAAGMLEVITGEPSQRPEASRIAVVAHISDLEDAPKLLEEIRSVPPGHDLIITTPDGRSAERLSVLVSAPGATEAASVDIRVTPSRRGRDMADFFIACRDVIVSDRYDLIVKVYTRPARRKTVNVRRYARRYQRENLLASASHVRAILALFDREPGLGLVLPPMMHIGYAVMGKGWGRYKKAVQRMCGELGIGVPLDDISPLAPFGGMWIARPSAVRMLAEQRWLYRDYGKHGRKRYVDLARVQERLVVLAAAEQGFHTRTVLSRQHASIVHTALEYKADELFSTSYGYPIDAIGLLHRAGPAGRGGIVGLSRMYLRLNHPLLAKAVLPFLAAAQWVFMTARDLMSDERPVRRTRGEDDEI